MSSNLPAGTHDRWPPPPPPKGGPVCAQSPPQKATLPPAEGSSRCRLRRRRPRLAASRPFKWPPARPPFAAGGAAVGSQWPLTGPIGGPPPPPPADPNDAAHEFRRFLTSRPTGRLPADCARLSTSRPPSAHSNSSPSCRSNSAAPRGGQNRKASWSPAKKSGPPSSTCGRVALKLGGRSPSSEQLWALACDSHLLSCALDASNQLARARARSPASPPRRKPAERAGLQLQVPQVTMEPSRPSRSLGHLRPAAACKPGRRCRRRSARGRHSDGWPSGEPSGAGERRRHANERAAERASNTEPLGLVSPATRLARPVWADEEPASLSQ